MLAYYAGKFPHVEINQHVLPATKEKVLLDWAAQVPSNFLAIKGEPEDHALCAAQAGVRGVRSIPGARNPALLADRVGPILFQTAAESQKGYRPAARFPRPPARGRRYAMEFRHASWFDDDQVFDALREHNVRWSPSAGRLQLTRACDRVMGLSPFCIGWLRRGGADGWAKRVNANGWKESRTSSSSTITCRTEARVR